MDIHIVRDTIISPDSTNDNISGRVIFVLKVETNLKAISKHYMKLFNCTELKGVALIALRQRIAAGIMFTMLKNSLPKTDFRVGFISYHHNLNGIISGYTAITVEVNLAIMEEIKQLLLTINDKYK